MASDKQGGGIVAYGWTEKWTRPDGYRIEAKLFVQAFGFTWPESVLARTEA